MATDFKSGLEISKFKAFFKDDRKDLVNMARIAEQAERYEDMCKFMRALVEWTDSKTEKQDLTVEERNLLSVAYKNVIGARRAAWRTLNVDDHKDDALIQVYKKQIEGELDGICQDVLKLLNAILLKNCTEAGEARVFYLKMAGDYYRYLAEFVTDQNYGQKAVNMYQEAMKIAQTKLAPPHPIRLGLALNFSVCYYEILHDKVRACELAKTAFDAAMQKLDQVREEMYKDCTLIMQLLRDNLTLWTSGDHDQLQMQDVDAAATDGADASAAQPAAATAGAPAAAAPAAGTGAPQS